MPYAKPTSVQFPPADQESKKKLTAFLENVSEFMAAPIKITKVTIIQAEVIGDRPDVMTILNKVAEREKKKETNGKPGAEAK